MSDSRLRSCLPWVIGMRISRQSLVQSDDDALEEDSRGIITRRRLVLCGIRWLNTYSRIPPDGHRTSRSQRITWPVGVVIVSPCSWPNRVRVPFRAGTAERGGIGWFVLLCVCEKWPWPAAAAAPAKAQPTSRPAIQSDWLTSFVVLRNSEQQEMEENCCPAMDDHIINLNVRQGLCSVSY